jgi:hypothetical protein
MPRVLGKTTINKDLELKSYLLAIQDLKDVYSNKYINSILLKALKEYNIKYNIIK